MPPTSTAPDTRRAGILLAVGTAIISGFAVFLNGFGVRAWADISDPATYTTLKNAAAALVLTVVAAAGARRDGSRLIDRPVLRRHWLGLTVIAVVGGSLPFLLFFDGLSRATSGDAAFIHKTLVIWVVLLAVTLLRERIGPLHVLAIATLIFGQAVIAGVGGFGFGPGEWMILGATLLWSVETVIAKRVLSSVPSRLVGIARMAGGSLVLVAYVLLFSDLSGLEMVTGEHLVWILITGVTLAGYVGTWFAALAKAPAVDVTAVLVGGALITAVLETGIRGAAIPSVPGIIMVTVGVVLIGALGWLRPAHNR